MRNGGPFIGHLDGWLINYLLFYITMVFLIQTSWTRWIFIWMVSVGKFSKSKGIGVFGNDAKDTNIPVKYGNITYWLIGLR